MMKKTLMAGAVVAALAAPTFAFAEDTPPVTITGNVGLFSQYLFRGQQQTYGNPAIQGGFDLSTALGFYLGTWASNISWLQDNGFYTSGAGIEWDFYGGYRNTIGSTDFGYDVGILQYQYFGDHVGSATANSTELYGALSWKFITAKISYNLFNYFGVADTDGTIYYDLSANYPIGETGLTVNAHYGYTAVSEPDTFVKSPGAEQLDYTDVKLGVTYALDAYSIGGYFSKATGHGDFTYGSGNIHAGGNQWVVFVSKAL